MDIQHITDELHSIESEFHFPITKQELITLAESKPISDEAKELLHHLPEQEFGSLEEIIQKLPFGAEIEGAVKNKLEGLL
jgi:hypothetical protein